MWLYFVVCSWANKSEINDNTRLPGKKKQKTKKPPNFFSGRFSLDSEQVDYKRLGEEISLTFNQWASDKYSAKYSYWGQQI